MTIDHASKRDANEILRERLLKIGRAGEKNGGYTTEEGGRMALLRTGALAN